MSLQLGTESTDLWRPDLPIITSNVSVHPSEPNANPMKDWMESHDHLLEVIPDDTFVLPAHNLPFYGVRARLRDLISHHDDRMLAIEEACVEPQGGKRPYRFCLIVNSTRVKL